MDILTIAGLAVIGFGIILFFILASRRNYRDSSAAQHYTRMRDELTLRGEEEEEIEEDEEEEGESGGSGGGIIGRLIGAFIAILIGVNLVPMIADTVKMAASSSNSTASLFTTNMLQAVPLFFVLGIIGVAASVLYSVLRDMGLIGSTSEEELETKPKAMRHYRKMRDDLTKMKRKH